MELAREALESAGLLHGIQVGALEIFNDRYLHRLLVGDLAEDGGDGFFAGQLRGAPAAFAGNELIAAAGQRADQDGLHDAVGDDGGGQLGQLILVDAGAGLEGIGFDLVEGNLARLARFGIGGGGGGLHTRKKRVQSFAESAALGVNRGDGHDSSSSSPALEAESSCF